MLARNLGRFFSNVVMKKVKIEAVYCGA